MDVGQMWTMLVAIGGLVITVSALQARMLRAEMKAMRSELSGEAGVLRADVKSEMRALRSDLSTEIAAVRSDLSTEITALRSDLAQYAAVSDRRLESLESDMHLIKGALVNQLSA